MGQYKLTKDTWNTKALTDLAASCRQNDWGLFTVTYLFARAAGFKRSDPARPLRICHSLQMPFVIHVEVAA
jgi:hypothetical protein